MGTTDVAWKENRGDALSASTTRHALSLIFTVEIKAGSGKVGIDRALKAGSVQT